MTFNNMSSSPPSSGSKKPPSSKNQQASRLSLPTATRRQSISRPQTTDSSTKVNNEKAIRRLSNRFNTKESRGPNNVSRLSSPTSQASSSRRSYSSSTMENRPPPSVPYSPPLTRSNRKNKLLKDKNHQGGSPMLCKRSGVLLEFSPPDQEENKRREEENIRIAETNRARRISHARQNGQLLVYNAANLHLLNGNLDYEKPTTPSRDPPDDSFFEHDEKSTCTSTLSEIQSQTNNIRHQNMIYNDDVANDIRNIKEMILASHSKSRDSNNFVIAEDILAKQESMNTKLIQDMVEKMSTLKGENSAQEARLTLQLETASGRIVMLEKTKEMLDEQVASLEQTNVTQGNRINDLHKDLLEKKDLVARLQTIIEALKQQNDVEKEELANECERYSELNENIQKELMGAKLDNEVLCQKIDTITLQLNEFNDTIIPALQDKLDKERIAVEQKQYSESDLRGQLNQRDIEVTTLKQTLHDLHERSEKEQQQLNELNHESSEYWNKLNSEMKEKELEIVRLTHEMIQLQEQLITEQHRNTTENKRLEELENKWNVERSKLTESLIEYENKYNAELQTNTDHQMSLSHAHSTINELVSSNEEIKLDLEQAKTQSCQLQIDLENARKTHEEELYKYENKLGHHEKERKQLEHERRLREVAEDKAKELERQLRETSEERDLARENISGFNEREAELFHRLRESDRIRREQHSRLMQLMGNIRVFVRVRPALPAELLLEEEAANNNVKRKRPEQDCDEFEDESTVFKFPGYYENSSNKNQHSSDDDITKNMIEVLAPWEERGGLKDRRKRHRFGFDHVFAPQHNQNDIWEATEPLVQSAIDGFNVTVFAYGQTGSGKTYTMLGDEENKGIIGRAVEKLFLAKHDIELMSCNETEVSISVELLEVYNEKVRDLLSSSNPKEVKVSSGEVIGNRIVSKITEEQVMKLLSLAQSRRCVKSTCSNSESSRSHMVFTVHFDVKMKDGIQRNGKLNICDLAGSERLNKSGAHHVGGTLLKETQNINKSLSVLSHVIEKLQAGDKNVPFRESQLTFLLKNSLSGNSKTLAIVCCNPLPTHYHESISSLRFAEKVSRVELKAVANFMC